MTSLTIGLEVWEMSYHQTYSRTVSYFQALVLFPLHIWYILIFYFGKSTQHNSEELAIFGTRIKEFTFSFPWFLTLYNKRGVSKQRRSEQTILSREYEAGKTSAGIL